MLTALYRWIEETDEADDLRRADITDPALLAKGALINRLMPPAYFCDQTIMAWLALEATRMWAQHGPGPTLIGPVSHVPYAISSLRQDHRTGHRLMRRILAVGEARGHEPETSQARFLYALGVSHWFEPLEDTMSQVLRAREGLILGGDLLNACYTYYATTYDLLDSAPSLDSFADEVESALAFAVRTGNDHVASTFRAYQRLVECAPRRSVATPTGRSRTDWTATRSPPSTSTSPGRSPPLCLTTRPSWTDTRRPRCRCCRLSSPPI